MIVPVLLSMLWFSTFGGTAIYYELFQGAEIAAAVLAAFPFMILMIVMAYFLYRNLSLEWQRHEETEKLLNSRIEQLLLRESEKEAVIQAGIEAHPTVEDTVSETDESHLRIS